jgi:hypothetical protein
VCVEHAGFDPLAQPDVSRLTARDFAKTLSGDDRGATWHTGRITLAEGDSLPMPDTTSRSRSWLSAAESRLVASSRGEALANATPAELRRKIIRARALRDKWRDVYETQRRGTQRATRGRGSAANARSREKGDLFDQVLRRLEARLAKLGASPGGSRAGRSAGVSKPARARGHRQTRAQAKRALAADVADRASAAARAAQAERPPMQTRRAQPSGGVARRRAGGKKKGTTKKATTKKATTRKSASKRAASKAKRVSRTGDRSATASTKYRLAVSGRTTRVRAHVAARGRRHQARRDRRG